MSDRPLPTESQRSLFVYKLAVTIPPECCVPGFVPAALLEKQRNEWYGPDYADQPFSWPKRRHYLSADSAYKRAMLLMSWGATVAISRARVEAWEPFPVWLPDELHDRMPVEYQIPSVSQHSEAS